MNKIIVANCPAIGRDDLCLVGLSTEYCFNKPCSIKEAVNEPRRIKTILDVVEDVDDE